MIEFYSVLFGCSWLIGKAKACRKQKAGVYLIPLYMRLLLFAYQPINGYAEHIAQCDKLCIRNIPQLALQL